MLTSEVAVLFVLESSLCFLDDLFVKELDLLFQTLHGLFGLNETKGKWARTIREQVYPVIHTYRVGYPKNFPSALLAIISRI